MEISKVSKVICKEMEKHMFLGKKNLLGQAEIADTEWILLSRPC